MVAVAVMVFGNAGDGDDGPSSDADCLDDGAACLNGDTV